MSQSSSVVERVVAVLWALAEQDKPATLQQIAKRCELPASTVHRMLRQLQNLGMATQTADRRYQPGVDLFYLGALVTTRSLVTEAVRPVIRDVIARSQRACLLSLYVPARRGRVLVAHIRPSDPLPLRFKLNLHRDLVWGSTGRAILAYLDKAHVEQAVDRAPPSPARGDVPPDRSTISRWLEAVRAQGFALSQGEVWPNGTAIAVPLFDNAGAVLGSLAITEEHCVWKPTLRDRLADILRRQSARLPALLAAQHGAKERMQGLGPFHSVEFGGLFSSRSKRRPITSRPTRRVWIGCFADGYSGVGAKNSAIRRSGWIRSRATATPASFPSKSLPRSR